VSELRDRLIVTDVQTGEEILSDDERAEVAEIRAEQEAIRADRAEEELRQLKEKLKAMGIPTEY